MIKSLKKIKILFIEDEENLLNSLSFILEANGFDVTKAVSGEEAVEKIKDNIFDMILLDISLPGMDGFETAEKIKKIKGTENTYVVILTGSSLENHQIKALESFADDYILKPVKPAVLIAKIHSILRRVNKNQHDESALVFGNLVIEPESREIFVDGENIELTKTEFDILFLMADSPSKVFSRDKIISIIKGYDYYITERSVDFQIFGLRKKLKDEGRRVITVRGVGYKFTEN